MHKMRWDCEKHGCFNKKMRLKFGAFSESFKGIGFRSDPNFTDIDGAVAINGKILIIEWKSNGKKLGVGQEILFNAFLKLSKKITIVVVDGNSETMEVKRFYQYTTTWKKNHNYIEDETLFEFIERWAQWANASVR